MSYAFDTLNEWLKMVRRSFLSNKRLWSFILSGEYYNFIWLEIVINILKPWSHDPRDVQMSRMCTLLKVGPWKKLLISCKDDLYPLHLHYHYITGESKKLFASYEFWKSTRNIFQVHFQIFFKLISGTSPMPASPLMTRLVRPVPNITSLRWRSLMWLSGPMPGYITSFFRFSWYLKKGTKHVPVQCETRKSFLLVTNLTKKRNIRCCFKKLILTRLDLNSKEVKITSSCVSRQQLPNI